MPKVFHWLQSGSCKATLSNCDILPDDIGHNAYPCCIRLCYWLLFLIIRRHPLIHRVPNLV